MIILQLLKLYLMLLREGIKLKKLGFNMKLSVLEQKQKQVKCIIYFINNHYSGKDTVKYKFLLTRIDL